MKRRPPILTSTTPPIQADQLYPARDRLPPRLRLRPERLPTILDGAPQRQHPGPLPAAAHVGHDHECTYASGRLQFSRTPTPACAVIGETILLTHGPFLWSEQTLTLVYHIIHRKINIRKEMSTSISVFSMASYVSLLALLIQQHWARTDWLELPFIALACQVVKGGGEVVVRVAQYANISIEPRAGA